MRWFAGLLLVFAAVLKAFELLYSPIAVVTAEPLGHLLLPIQIGVELTVGLFLISGLYWRALRWIAAGLFTIFAGYSLYLALAGVTSCHCFGPVRVHPWLMFVVDMFIVAGIIRSIVADRRQNMEHLESRVVPMVPQFRIRRAIVAAITAVSMVSTALLVRAVDRRTASADGVTATPGKSFVLEPDKWVGHRLPIAEFIDIDLSRGRWVALLHRQNGHECDKTVPNFEQRAQSGERVALIEVPPYHTASHPSAACAIGRLKDDRQWFVQTPIEVHLQDGIVTAVSHHVD